MALSYDDLLRTTLQHRAKDVQDAISNRFMFMKQLEKKGRVKKQRGGRTLIETLHARENGSFQWYFGGQQLNISPSHTLQEAEADWKQCAVAVLITGREMLINDGEDAIFNLMDERVENAEITMQNRFAEAIYGDGTGDGGLTLSGLQLYLADDPTTGTVSGIDSSDSDAVFWRNKVADISSEAGGAASATTIVPGMNILWRKVLNGPDGVDLILADDIFYGYYETYLQGIQRVTTSKLADAGYEALRYKTADVVLDGGMGGSMPASHMFFVNSSTFTLQVHPDRYFAPMKPTRHALNQDALVDFVGFFGNLTCKNRRLNGVLKA